MKEELGSSHELELAIDSVADLMSRRHLALSTRGWPFVTTDVSNSGAEESHLPANSSSLNVRGVNHGRGTSVCKMDPSFFVRPIPTRPAGGKPGFRPREVLR